MISVWQMLVDKLSPAAIRHATAPWRELFDGVYLSGHAWPTDHQRLIGAALTTPNAWVDRWSAAWFYGLRDHDTGPVTIARAGTGGERKLASRFPSTDDPDPRFGLSVRRSLVLPADDCTAKEAIPVLSGARTVLDLMPQLRIPDRRARLVRDALRLQVATPAELHAITRAHKGRRGVGELRGLLDRYARLPATRAKSDAELLAASILEEAGFPRPYLNVLVAGEEGDLVFPGWHHIVELDSHGYHPFPEVDERKQRIWEAAGWTVGRVPTDAVHDAPAILLAEAIPPKLRGTAVVRGLKVIGLPPSP